MRAGGSTIRNVPVPPVLNVGFYNFVLTDKIIALVSSESAPMRRVVQTLRKSGNLIDATHGRRTKSIIFTQGGAVVLSAISQETLAKRLSTGELGAEVPDEE
jgi:extracellular matrix regulatory protein A